MQPVHVTVLNDDGAVIYADEFWPGDECTVELHQRTGHDTR